MYLLIISVSRLGSFFAFLKKRIIRILPSYYVVLTAWLIYQHLRSGISVSSVFANYLCVDFLAGADFQTLWYMNGVWIYYLFALFLVPLCQNASLRRKILLFFLCATFSVPFFSDIRLMLFSRLPLLFLGICFADYGARHEEIPARLAAALIALSCLGWGLLAYIVKCVPDDRIWAYGLYWFPFILIAPGLCIVLSLLAACLDKVAPQIIRGFTFLGGCTLEIYAVSRFCFPGLSRCTLGRHLVWHGQALASAFRPVCALCRFACPRNGAIDRQNTKAAYPKNLTEIGEIYV